MKQTKSETRFLRVTDENDEPIFINLDKISYIYLGTFEDKKKKSLRTCIKLDTAEPNTLIVKEKIGEIFKKLLGMVE